MLERLLENWLDSASERSYQPCFVQLLSGQGYQVLHSTRHCALEFGKDVIAIAPDGVACAYQLKGNPGSSLGLGEFRRDIQAQLIQLTSQPIVFPGVSTDVPHRSYLVSNGYFEEEVQRAVDDLNRAKPYSSVELISRGQLFEWAKRLGATMWPSELSTIREFIGLFLHNERDLFPRSRFASILEPVFGLNTNDGHLSGAQLQRSATSAALLTGVGVHQFAEAENHFAVTTAWCIYFVSAVAAAERAATVPTGQLESAMGLAEASIKDALVALWNEVQGRAHLAEGDAWADPDVYRWRYTLLHGLLSVLWFFPGDSEEDANRRQEVSEWLRRRDERFDLWGEGAIPTILAYLFFLRRTDPTIRPDWEIAGLLKTVVRSNRQYSNRGLPDPYYEYEDVVRKGMGLPPRPEFASLASETFRGSSYTAESLLQLVARSMLKSPCREVWPEFSKIGHKRFIPMETWQYAVLHSNEGMEEMRQYPAEYQWSELRRDASVSSCNYVPEYLARRPHLLLLWTIIAPYRFTSDVARLLAATLPRY